MAEMMTEMAPKTGYFTSESERNDFWASLPPGFRFHPTDEELVLYYLKRKASTSTCLNLAIIAEIDIYKWEPEDLPGQSVLKNGDKKWYFFNRRERKYPKGSRASRQTNNGYWKITGRDRSITYKSQVVGSKKTLVFYRGRAPSARRTDWVIQEYTLDQRQLENSPNAAKDSYVLCKFYEKNGSGPMHPNDFGGAYNEEEWDTDEKLVEDNAMNREKLVHQLNGCTSLDISPVQNHWHHPNDGEEEISMDIEEKPLIHQPYNDNSSGEQPVADNFYMALPQLRRQKNEPEMFSFVENRADDISELQKKIEALKKELDDLESLNQTLTVRENINNCELQEARSELISGLQNIVTGPSTIGVRQLGKVDKEPFTEICFRKFSNEEREKKTLELLSFWQQEVANPEWHPFKKITLLGKTQEAVDINDEKLVKLKKEWGRDVYEAVIVALKEMKEYNGNGRSMFLELWNFQEKRKATLKEGIHFMLKHVEPFKNKRKR